MYPTRVFLMGLRPMLGELIRTVVQAEPELTLVGWTAATDLRAAERARADVVVLSLARTSDADVVAQLAGAPGLRIVGIVPGSGMATLYEMRPHRQFLGELGLARLTAALLGVDGRSEDP